MVARPVAAVAAALVEVAAEAAETLVGTTLRVDPAGAVIRAVLGSRA